MSCIVASLVQVMLDPHFRTIPGFQSLIQKEWVMAGYQFLDRCNHLKRSEKEVTQLSAHCGSGGCRDVPLGRGPGGFLSAAASTASLLSPGPRPAGGALVQTVVAAWVKSEESSVDFS